MTAVDLFSLLVPVTFLAFLVIESLFKTGRPWPKIRWWVGAGILERDGLLPRERSSSLGR